MIKVILPFLLFLVASSLSADTIKTFRAYLKPQSVLTRLSDKSNYTLTRGIYADVTPTSTTRTDYFIVYDKTGKALYEAPAEAVVEITADFELLPKLDAGITYPAPSVAKQSNQFAFFDTQFNLHLDRLQTSAFNEIYAQELEAAMANRWEIRTLYVSELPVNFGFSFNYQTATWENDLDEVKLSILSFGPQLERALYAHEQTVISIHLGAEYAPLYRTSSGDLTENYQAVLFDLGVEATWDTRFGKWSAGSHFRRHDLTLSSTDRTGVTLVPSEIIVNSIGAMVGYKYEWDL